MGGGVGAPQHHRNHQIRAEHGVRRSLSVPFHSITKLYGVIFRIFYAIYMKITPVQNELIIVLVFHFLPLLLLMMVGSANDAVPHEPYNVV